MANNCTNAWNLNPPAPAAPGLHPHAAPSGPSAAASTAPYNPPQPHPLAASATPASHPSTTGSAFSVSTQAFSHPPFQQDPLLAGLILVPASPHPCSSMPSLEELPPGGAPSPVGILDPQGFLTNHRPPQPVFIPNPPFLSSSCSVQSLAYNSVGNSSSSSNLNVKTYSILACLM